MFKVSIIPHTGAETTLLEKKAGDIVNLENDIVGKYVQRLLSPYGNVGAAADNETASSGLTMDKLIEFGL